VFLLCREDELGGSRASLEKDDEDDDEFD